MFVDPVEVRDVFLESPAVEKGVCLRGGSDYRETLPGLKKYAG